MLPLDEGVLAAASGIDEAHNPHAEVIEAHAQWEQGFHGAKEDEFSDEDE